MVKRSAFALGFLLVWWLFEIILIYLIRIPEILGKLLPLESMSNLIIEPFTRLKFVKTIGTQIGVENSKDYSVHLSSIVIVLIWTAIFMFLSYKILKKRDL